MPNFYARLNLASSIYPLYTEMGGRTVMVPDLDENFDRYNAANTTPDKGVPQVLYMHNCVPVSGGFQSVGYNQVLPGLDGNTDFDTVYPIVAAESATVLYVPSQGANYVFDGNVGTWVSTSPAAPGTTSANTLVTTALVQGISYIFFQGIGCFNYSTTTKTLVPVTLTGLTISLVIGITAANGYLIAWTRTGVFWSALVTPTNFIPSIQTGAGGGSVADAKGPINFCVPLPGGFVIYCQKNAVGASYTANTNFPYIIKEITGSGGVASPDNVAFQGNVTYHLAMTSAGLQQVSLDSAISTMPEVSDFLTANTFEDFDEITVSFTAQNLTAPVGIKLAMISERFIIISYGVQPPDYTHAILYDMALNRYGKLKINHRCAFSFISPAPYGLITYEDLLMTTIDSLGSAVYGDFFVSLQPDIIPKQNLAFLQQDGTVRLVDFSIGEFTADGVFIIGKFQYRRGNVMVHQRTEVDTLNQGETCNLFLLPTFDGKDFTAAVATTVIQSGPLTRTFAKRFTASNISLCLIGAFNLTSMVMNFTIGGSR